MLSVMGGSVLELSLGGLPFPHGDPDGRWRYRHAVRPEGPTALDHQAVNDFLAYEHAHGRRVDVVADPALSGWETWRAPVTRPHPGAFATQCCTHAYPRGCTARLVCHGAPASSASQILADGVLRPAIAVKGRAATDLAAASTWGEPADYFEHVMLANGRCTAPEAVASSRVLGRDLVPADLSPGYLPAVRFYFDWEVLSVRPDRALRRSAPGEDPRRPTARRCPRCRRRARRPTRHRDGRPTAPSGAARHRGHQAPEPTGLGDRSAHRSCRNCSDAGT